MKKREEIFLRNAEASDAEIAKIAERRRIAKRNLYCFQVASGPLKHVFMNTNTYIDTPLQTPRLAHIFTETPIRRS